jgi:hypothetical protein
MVSFMKIKKSFIFMQLILMSLTSPVFAQQEQQQEYVQVVNVEMILRVLKDGSPVGGLKKNDFALYEDGEKSEINGFFEIHRRIAPADKSQQQPRLYLLFFWVSNPGADVEGVLNKFFSTIYREGDRVILATPLKTFELPSPQTAAETTAAFLEQWRQEAKNGVLKRIQFHNELNWIFEDFIKFKKLNSFISRYSMEIKGYQNRELLSDTTAFEAMARSLLPIKNDKFALVFFQHDSLPLLDVAKVSDQCLMNGFSNETITVVEDQINEIERQVKTFLNFDSFSQKIKSLFIQANTQFHLLFLSSDKSDGPIDVSSKNPSTKNEAVFSNWEQVMREVSKNTGGLMLDGDQMVAALDQVASFEDIYYHITYVPRGQGAKKRKIDIRVDQPGMKVIYGRTLEMNELPLVKIAEISATSQLIRLTVADFYSFAKNGVPTGSVNVYVTGKPAGKEPPRLLISQASETTGTIEMPFAFPQPGNWDLEVRVVDQITGRQDEKKAQVEIAAAIPAAIADAAPDPALIALLAKGSAYAEKLKKTAFHFFCREKVTEDKFGVNARFDRQASRSYWIHDYQIVGQNGKITETRVLLEKDRKTFNKENAQLETVFRSLYSFYMPVTILAGEKQHLYQYRILDKKKKVWHIAAVRRDPALKIPWGEIWIREVDGVVLKIQVEQTSIVGFEKMAQQAKERGIRPEITTIHEYGVEENQIHFPSKTTFIEGYNSDYAPTKKFGNESIVFMGTGHRSFERSRTYFEYDKYRFFFVETSVEEKTE